MNKERFNHDKSALLTALLAALDTCHRIHETLQRHEATNPNPTGDINAINDMLNDVTSFVEATRDAVDDKT